MAKLLKCDACGKVGQDTSGKIMSPMPNAPMNMSASGHGEDGWAYIHFSLMRKVDPNNYQHHFMEGTVLEGAYYMPLHSGLDLCDDCMAKVFVALGDGALPHVRRDPPPVQRQDKQVGPEPERVTPVDLEDGKTSWTRLMLEEDG
jgi:hypothetical protein